MLYTESCCLKSFENKIGSKYLKMIQMFETYCKHSLQMTFFRCSTFCTKVNQNFPDDKKHLNVETTLKISKSTDIPLLWYSIMLYVYNYEWKTKLQYMILLLLRPSSWCSLTTWHHLEWKKIKFKDNVNLTQRVMVWNYEDNCRQLELHWCHCFYEHSATFWWR